MFILYVLELLRWDGDKETLRLYYPTVKRAAMWQVSRLKCRCVHNIAQFDNAEYCR